MKMKCKKGFTLVELCIVMALVAIVGVMMTSFIAVFQPRVAQNQARHDFLDEVALVRDEMQKWIETNDAGSVTLVAAGSDASEDKIIERKDSETAIYVSFSDDGNLTFSYDASTTKTIELKTITTITLTAYEPEQLTDPEDETKLLPPPSNYGKLLVCTLSGTDAFEKEYKQSFVFSIRSSGATFANDEAPTEP